MSEKKGRSFEKRFEVAASVEAVWKAITEYAVLSVTPAEGWSRLMSAQGLVKTGALDDLTVGAPWPESSTITCRERRSRPWSRA
jgi:hypothetical protein